MRVFIILLLLLFIPFTQASAQIAAGDVNGDSSIDLVDFNIWRDAFTNGTLITNADINNDSAVDIVDFNAWFTAFQTAATKPTPSPLQTFYVSPTGSDTNPGTQSNPWKTFKKAATTLRAGQQAIFEDGTYLETSQVTLTNSGTATQPIIFSARNKHKAIIRFQNRVDAVKIYIENKDYITIKDFEITQDGYGTGVVDALVRTWTGADSISIIGNKIHNAYELMKTSLGDNHLVAGNIFYDTQWGIGWTISDNIIIKNNEFYNFRENAIQTKMNSKNARVYNNTFRSGIDYVNNGIALVLGGVSCGSTDPVNCGNSDPSGYEGYGHVAYNNIIRTDPGGELVYGIGLVGCFRCGAFNNVIIGADSALAALRGGGIAKGWTHDTLSVEPEYKNNIVYNCGLAFNNQSGTGSSGRVTLAYNLFYICPNPTNATASVTQDPLFISSSDFHLKAGSPALNKGSTISFTNNAGQELKHEIGIDRDGKPRVFPWNIGAY